MKLIRCNFTGLKGYPILDLEDLPHLVILTGPNGTGKTTILRVLNFALQLLAKGTLCEALEGADPWVRFDTARLTFELEAPLPRPSLPDWFPVVDRPLEVRMLATEQHFGINEIRCDGEYVAFPDPQATRKELTLLQREIAVLEQKYVDVERALGTAAQSKVGDGATLQRQQQELRRQLQAINPDLSRMRTELEKRSSVLVSRSGSKEEFRVSRVDIDKLITALMLPESLYIDVSTSYARVIPELISTLLKQKKGRRSEANLFGASLQRLRHVLQAEVDIFEDNGREQMLINGTTYEKASSGTKVTLSYFGITHLEKPNRIVLWDEPENGLHPTRRARLLELILEDPRQFFLATHTPEFVPLLSPRGRIYRCTSEYDSTPSDLELQIQLVAGRRDAFATLEALGVHPARALFTANVVIWVEGPTELLFYRHWLVPRFKKLDLHEGFHYTFMQYGGALITYLSLEEQPQVESTFDLLSLCRNPVLLVDSDLSADPGIRSPAEFLKPGARRLYEEVQKLNETRRGAAHFEFTAGREIENYLPAQAIWHAVAANWKGYKAHVGPLQERLLKFGKYEHFETALEKHFIAAALLDESNQPRGRSLWGATNKVAMMRAALTTPGLSEEQLNWDCTQQLDRIEEFVRRSATG